MAPEFDVINLDAQLPNGEWDITMVTGFSADLYTNWTQWFSRSNRRWVISMLGETGIDNTDFVYLRLVCSFCLFVSLFSLLLFSLLLE